jgi:hypothetical protein
MGANVFAVDEVSAFGGIHALTRSATPKPSVAVDGVRHDIIAINAVVASRTERSTKLQVELRFIFVSAQQMAGSSGVS